jgi:hypothetical protein
MFRSAAITLALCFAAVTAQAALLGRAALTPGGTDYQAYYDDELNITWVADANLAATSNFGVTGINPDGTMSWYTAQSWIGAMNAASYLGASNWRLPTTIDVGQLGCLSNIEGDCGYNVDPSTSEMAHMFFSTLGNSRAFDTSGSPTGCLEDYPNYCLTNTGPFSNLQPYPYWSGTTHGTSYLHRNGAWFFSFNEAYQGLDHKSNTYNAWAVSDGDSLATVPVPASVWLFGSALGVMGVMRRKAAA